MLPYFSDKFGNASSKTHPFGWIAEDAVKDARKQVAELIHCEEEEIIFTSGATEAINLAIKGVFENYGSPSLSQRDTLRNKTKGNHIVTVQTEHKAVLDTCRLLEKKGAEITYLKVDREGRIDLNELKDSINEKTILVSVMFANNETGVIHPMKEIAAIVHEKGSILMSDATQAVGKINVDVKQEGIDLLCMSAHKMYGPKGAGALFIRRKNPRVSLLAQTSGGGHERGLRSGTLNVPGIAGLGKACEIAKQEMWDDSVRLSKLRTFLEQSLLDLGDVFVNGSIRDRLSHVSNLSIHRIKADELIVKAKDISMATGSACTSAVPEPSHVLKAMGVPDESAYSSVRFSLGKFTTKEEIDFTIKKIGEAIRELRK